jgi:hypothetical protein
MLFGQSLKERNFCPPVQSEFAKRFRLRMRDLANRRAIPRVLIDHQGCELVQILVRVVVTSI